MKSHFLSFQGSYKNVEIAIFNNNECIGINRYENFNISANLIPKLDFILSKRNLSIKNITFIALDQGPGAFTSLRATISTINGISFASRIPLIGIEGIDALASETLLKEKRNWKNEKDKTNLLVVILNAYNKEVFFGIYKIEGSFQNPKLELLQEKGYKKISILLEELAKNHKQNTILFSGNGTKIYQNVIVQNLESRTIFASPLLETCSAKHVGILAFEQFTQGINLKNKILPLYLKTQKFKPKF